MVIPRSDIASSQSVPTVGSRKPATSAQTTAPARMAPRRVSARCGSAVWSIVDPGHRFRRAAGRGPVPVVRRAPPAWPRHHVLSPLWSERHDGELSGLRIGARGWLEFLPDMRTTGGRQMTYVEEHPGRRIDLQGGAAARSPRSCALWWHAHRAERPDRCLPPRRAAAPPARSFAAPTGWRVTTLEHVDLWLHGFALLTSDTGRVPFFARGYKQQVTALKRQRNLFTQLDANQPNLSARFSTNPALANAQFVAMYFPSFQEIVNATDLFIRSNGDPRAGERPANAAGNRAAGEQLPIAGRSQLAAAVRAEPSGREHPILSRLLDERAADAVAPGSRRFGRRGRRDTIPSFRDF